MCVFKREEREEILIVKEEESSVTSVLSVLAVRGVLLLADFVNPCPRPWEECLRPPARLEARSLAQLFSAWEALLPSAFALPLPLPCPGPRLPARENRRICTPRLDSTSKHRTVPAFNSSREVRICANLAQTVVLLKQISLSPVFQTWSVPQCSLDSRCVVRLAIVAFGSLLRLFSMASRLSFVGNAGATLARGFTVDFALSPSLPCDMHRLMNIIQPEIEIGSFKADSCMHCTARCSLRLAYEIIQVFLP